MSKPVGAMGRSCAVLAIIAVTLLTASCSPRATPTDTTPRAAASPSPTTQAIRPRDDITPGAVLTTSVADVCTSGWATAHRKSLSAAQKRRVLALYGLPASTHVAEWDHLVSLELGGANGTANIWPEFDAAGKASKDRLENELHAEVCDGLLSLPEAQKRIKVYWLWWDS